MDLSLDLVDAICNNSEEEGGKQILLDVLTREDTSADARETFNSMTKSQLCRMVKDKIQDDYDELERLQEEEENSRQREFIERENNRERYRARRERDAQDERDQVKRVRKTTCNDPEFKTTICNPDKVAGRKAYRKAMLEFHPDRCDTPHCRERMHAANECNDACNKDV